MLEYIVVYLALATALTLVIGFGVQKMGWYQGYKKGFLDGEASYEQPTVYSHKDEQAEPEKPPFKYGYDM